MGKSKKRNNEGAGEGNSSVEVVEKEIEVISSAIICKLCLDEISPENKIILDSCGCFYCLSCMKSYVEVQVSEGFVLSLTCPDADCIIQGTLSIDEVSRLAQREIFEKYLRLKYEQEVASDPLRTFCPNVHCSSVCHVYLKQQHEQSNSHKKKKKKKQEDSVKAGQPVSVACQTCYTTFCNICKAEWTAEHKCTDMNSSISNDLTRLQARTGLSLTGKADALIKRCPVCNVLIEKDRGCAQMICKNCTHVFCWYCLKLLDKDFMLRHYDEGPCRKFLGHSRAQVFRHRLGVVGLFTAFSLLLVVASPILLLTAPVFLCCKCKICCQRAIHQARQHNNNTIFSESFSESRNLPNKKENSPQVVVETTSQEHSSTPLEETVTPTHTTTDNCTVEQTTL